MGYINKTDLISRFFYIQDAFGEFGICDLIAGILFVVIGIISPKGYELFMICKYQGTNCMVETDGKLSVYNVSPPARAFGISAANGITIIVQRHAHMIDEGNRSFSLSPFVLA